MRNTCRISVVAAVALTAMSSLTAMVGLYHDDGIYVTTAQSIAEGSGYSLIGIPTTPPQTKYPPLYPLLLSLVWGIAPSFPSNALMLKTLSIVALAIACSATAAYYRRVSSPTLLEETGLTLVVGLNALSLSLVDFPMSDHLFGALAAVSLVVHSKGSQGGQGFRRIVAASTLATLAISTRQVGAAIAFAGMAWAYAEARSRGVALYVVAPASYLVLQRALGRGHSETINPLLQYYTGYEADTLWALISSPVRLAMVIRDNAFYLVRSIDLVVFMNVLPGLGLVLGGLALAGLVVLLRRSGVFVVGFTMSYTALVLVYPFHPIRYILPLVPVIFVCVFEGSATLRRMPPRFTHFGGARVLLQIAGILPLLLVCTSAVLWAAGFVLAKNDQSVRLWLGVRATYQWSGFEETFQWVKGYTSTDAILATPYDPMYFLYTGRRGVRPWIHQPETYFYPRQRPMPSLGEPARLRSALDELGVGYLIEDPLDGYAEAPAAPSLYSGLLKEYGPAAQLVFESADKRHRVYRLVRGNSAAFGR